MALNYGIQFNAYKEDGTTKIADAKVHTYFYQVNGSSSTSTWDAEIKLTNGIGQVSTNLGNSSFLTSDGKVDNGDIVLVTAWLTDNTTQTNDKSSKEAGKLLRCVNFIHVVDTSSSSWVENFVLPEVLPPTCNINFPTSTLTGHSFTIGNTSTVNEGAFSYNTGDVNRSDLYQNFYKYSQTLFIGREINETNYNLIETNQTLNTTTNLVYSWVDAGVYNTVTRVYNHLGYYCEETKTYTIKYNKPTIAFDFTFTKLLNSSKHIGVGDDDLLHTVQQSSTNFGDTWAQIQATFDWYIYDLNQNGTDNSDTYDAQDENFEPTKLYNSSSLDEPKYINLSINWNDGFDNHQEVLQKVPYLDIYNIAQSYNWITQKSYQSSGVYVPLGDDDLMTVTHTNYDNASQNYNSNSQWKSLLWTVQKKKNDGSAENEDLQLIQANSDNYNEAFAFYVRFLHTSTDLAEINQKLIYWDGWKDVEKNLSKTFSTQNYIINHTYHWSTSRYGSNKVITHDADEVTIINDSTFGPQNNQDVVQEDKYNVTKDKYTSYTDATVLQDNEEFIYNTGNLSNTPKFFVHKEGTVEVLNTISYYDGYQDKVSTSTRTLTAAVLTPNPKFKWLSRNGADKTVVGRDDLVTFVNESTVTDYYNLEFTTSSIRNLNIDWYIHNYITAGNYNDPAIIGGATYTSDEDVIHEYLDQELTFTPKINYWTAVPAQNITMNFAYNDGYFNRDIDLSKNITTAAYSDLIPGASYPSNIPDRNTDVVFSDNSTNNEVRIIDEDWSLTDRYESNSMTVDKQDLDNLQTWINVSRETVLTTRINSNENHTLSQDVIRWDDGFKLKLFNNSYTIATSAYTINPKFTYEQIYITGPEIEFTNTGTKNGSAQLLTHDYEIEDKFNDGADAFASYQDIPYLEKTQHTYKSVSNSPFEVDTANKEVTIFQDYDNGWNRVYDTYTEMITVKPNRITQNFSLEAIRHPSDVETSSDTITGNNPIKFTDTSDTSRIDSEGNKDFSFINSVKYVIEETC